MLLVRIRIVIIYQVVIIYFQHEHLETEKYNLPIHHIEIAYVRTMAMIAQDI